MSIINNIGGVLLKPIIKEMSRSRLPKLDGQISVEGLKEEVEIIRDEWGIAHIYAKISMIYYLRKALYMRKIGFSKWNSTEK